MTNVYIDNILLGRAHNFIGTFSSDTIETSNKKIFTFVCNLSQHNEPGTHFVGVQINSEARIIEYFDPYGRPCTNYDILSYLKKYGKKIIHTTKQIQNYESDFCGIHCMAFMLSKNVGCTYDKFIDIYSVTNTLSNDAKSTQYIVHILSEL